MLSVRPKVAELVFQLYGRALHPELFEIHSSRVIERKDYTAKLWITSAGHVVTWRSKELTLTEVAAAAHHELPEKRRLVNQRLKGSQHERVECFGGITYEVDYALETVDTGAFKNFQQEIALVGSQQGLLHQFEPSGRFGQGAMSFMHVQSRQRSLCVQTVHTFPDDCVLVKSQSWFKLPELLGKSS